jgi:hypothetical protein
MKTILNVCVILTLVLFSNVLLAVGNLKLNVLPISDQKALVSILSLENSVLNISLTDENGNIVYYHESDVVVDEFSKIFNFSKLDNGNYKLKVVCGDFTTERLIQKSADRVSVGDEMTTIQPYFGIKGNVLKCSYLNFDKEYVVFHLFKNNTELYTKPIGKHFDVQQALNLSKLNKGDYEAVLTAGDRQFTYRLEIK